MVARQFTKYLNIILAMIFWAFSFVWVKEAYQSFGPVTTIFARLIISTLLLFLVLKITKKLQPVHKSDYKLFLLLALFEPLLYFMCESFGLKLVSSTLASVIISTTPIFSSIFAFLVLKERLTIFSIIGIIISFSGVSILIFENGFQLSAPILGILLMFGSVLSTIGYSLSLKKLASKYPPVNIIAYQNLIGIFMFLPVFLLLELKTLSNIDFKLNAGLAILQLAIFASSIAFIFFAKSIKQLGVAKTNMFINLIPVFTAVFAWWILNDKIDAQKIFGIATVIIGLFISQIRIKKHEA
ncbi:DMT family transporter [Plebeiibacterium sediminum]|uniref:DMT family transporter n=1 Tax=Plebeiibacterium sediminum TaxID=2992112 RepID=A0AAE3SHB0_9BACT|nr:DMT family transporter [Plebeiobacterium sediminum]MCW3788043.1 DMT family transporter [Plebeiobacterium sediminum]